MEDEKILELYRDRDEQAIRETIAQYESYCRTVALGILSNEADVEEVLSEVWLRAWESIPPQEPEYLRLYLAKITRNQAMSRLRRESAQRRGGGQVALALEELGECVSGSQSAEGALDAKELQEAINAFLHTLPQRDRVTFLRRYFYLEDTKTIAAQLHTKETNLRMLLSRTRKKLKNYLIQEGYEL